MYKRDILGGFKDRREGHNENTGIVYLYLSEEDFKERFDVPVLGNIPDFAKAKSGKYYKNYKYYGKGGNK